MDEEFVEEISVPVNVEMIAIALDSDLALRMDAHLMNMQQNPECPESLKLLPLWALRSNMVGEALSQMFELGDLSELWRGMDD